MLHSAIATAAVISLHAPLVQAATYYWDTNGAASGSGSATNPNSWLTANNWASAPGGTSATSTWPNANPNSDTALFPATAGTVVVNGSVFVNSIEFDAANYNITSTANNYLTFSGSNPTVNANLSGNGTVTLTTPLAGSNGLTIDSTGGTRVLLLANTSATNVNTLTGNITINTSGFLRLGGGTLTEQIADSNDLTVYGILDFITGSGASDGKQEKVHNVTASGSSANFSIGYGTNFIMNSATSSLTGAGQGLALVGNNATHPTQLTINGWDGGGTLALADGSVRLNTTGAAGSTGGSIVKLSGDLISSGQSEVYNANGAAASAATNVFPYQNFEFENAAQSVNVTSGTLIFSSASTTHVLEITSAAVGGTTITKTGAGAWVLANASETTFTGTTRIDQGTLQLAASERLADSSTLTVSGGALDLQSFNETVGSVNLNSGTIGGTGALTSAQGFAVQSGFVSAALSGPADLVKSSSGIVTLTGLNNYSGSTRVQNGILVVAGTVGTDTLSVEGGQAQFNPDLSTTSIVHGLSIASGASLDLSNNSLVIDYTGGSGAGSLGLLQTYLNDGRLNSSAANSSPTQDQRIGYRDNQNGGSALPTLASFAGVSVDPSSILIGFTYAGDTNLDGRVDVADLLNLALHYNQSGNWQDGDFDYNGSVNIDDLRLLALDWGMGITGQLPALSPLLATFGLPDVTVPEPVTCALVTLCGIGVSARRRRRLNRATH